jgi:hypothetical protein
VSGEPRYVVYRAYDSKGVLLYVGSTGRLATRRYSHSREKSWWPRVARITTEEFPERASARAAERRAIRLENPVHNLYRGKTPLRNLRVADEVWKPALEKARAEGKTLTEVIIEFLRCYISGADSEELDERTREAMSAATQKVIAELDRFGEALLGKETYWQKACGHPPDPDVVAFDVQPGDDKA